ncbi:Zinc-type alcohol dehydrogenase-like protein [Pseudomonas sp. AD21]|nr:Zinc-type alcohol dehydrogenase-like protein [Pseudomonas sp. AD21]
MPDHAPATLLITDKSRTPMKAFLIDRYGKHPGRQGEVPAPAVGPHDVLIEVHASSVNVLDSKISAGEFKLILPYAFPLILGNDLAGVVIEVGSKVTRFQPGDEVYARPPETRIGTFAELIAVHEHAIALKPANTNMAQAASLPLVALTAWQVLVDTARLQKGQKVLIHAGSGGVGSVAIQLAKHLGAFVATTTSTANVEWVKALGADVVIDYKQQNFETVLHDYDVVVEQSRRRCPGAVTQSAQARWSADFHLGATHRAIRSGARVVLAIAASHAPAEPRHSTQGPQAERQLHVCVHARQWRSTATNQRASRGGNHQTGD